MSYQPLSPPQPTTSVFLALQNVPERPLTPTNVPLISGTPYQTTTNFSEIQQLPSNYVTALVSQQAVNNNTLSSADKIKLGIIDSPTGITLSQASLPGQSIKPGAGEFVAQLWQANPDLPFNSVATNVLMTGNYGITSAADLVKNTPAQTGAITASIRNSTTQLTNFGILRGDENPTQTSGVVFAATTLGLPVVASALSDPLKVPTTVGGSVNPVGQAISSGTYAAALADTQFNGANGVSTSLENIINGNTSTLSGGVLAAASRSSAGIGTIIGTNSSSMQNAYNLSEKSYGVLKAGEPNTLGPIADIPSTRPSETVQVISSIQLSRDELSSARNELLTARKNYYENQSDESYQTLRTAEFRAADAEKKLAVVENRLLTGTELPLAGNNAANLFGTISAQDIQTTAAAAESGMLNAPTSANTGLNAIPGGLNAFAAQTGTNQDNIVDAVKTVVAGSVLVSSQVISNPTNLAGNILANTKNIITGVSNGIAQGISLVTGVLGSIGSGIQSGLTNLTNGIASNTGSLISGITASLSSLGNSSGQIRPAILATNTYAETKAVINSTINATLDPKVPPPTFEEVLPKFNADEYNKAQVDAQQAIDNLLAEREKTAYELDQAINNYVRDQQVQNVGLIDRLSNELAAYDVQLISAQNNYERIISK